MQQLFLTFWCELIISLGNMLVAPRSALRLWAMCILYWPDIFLFFILESTSSNKDMIMTYQYHIIVLNWLFCHLISSCIFIKKKTAVFCFIRGTVTVPFDQNVFNLGISSAGALNDASRVSLGLKILKNMGLKIKIRQGGPGSDGIKPFRMEWSWPCWLNYSQDCGILQTITNEDILSSL